MAQTDPLGALLDDAAPSVSTAEACEIAATCYGITATARLLSGERDHNFHLLAADGREYVLKLIHPAEDAGVTEFQSEALLHIEATDPTLPTPRLIRPLGGGTGCELVAGGVARRVRLLTYLSGQPLYQRPASPALRRNLGTGLARLDLALAGFAHKSDRHPLLWDLQRASQVRPLLGEVPPERRALPLRALDRFEANAAPLLPQLRAQVIHNDFNPHNVLADGSAIAGIIDFGDMVRAPLVQDLATAAAYQIGTDGPVLQNTADLVSAFHTLCPLQQQELQVLPVLIATRLMLTIAISSWRAHRHPGNAGYILRNQQTAWSGLELLDSLDPNEAVDALAQACSKEMTQ